MDDNKLGRTTFRYTPDAGTVQGPCYCGVCETEMKEDRGRLGPRSFVEAMGKSKSAYDSFVCPHAEEVWHEQVVALYKEANSTPSGTLEKLYLGEAESILKTREKTKSTWKWL